MLYVANVFCQSSSDTIKIRKDFVEFAENSTYRAEKDVYKLNGKPIDNVSFELMKNRADSIEAILDNNHCKYYIFLAKDAKTILEEGWWYRDCFSGFYKKYFENGNIKEQGYYTEACDSIYFTGQKIGKWNYYSKDGKSIKTVSYKPTLYRKNDRVNSPIPPCRCSQKDLYKDKVCGTLPPSQLKGITFQHSALAFFNKTFANSEINKESSYELMFLKKYAADFMDSVFSKKKCINDCLFSIKIYKHNT